MCAFVQRRSPRQASISNPALTSKPESGNQTQTNKSALDHKWSRAQGGWGEKATAGSSASSPSPAPRRLRTPSLTPGCRQEAQTQLETKLDQSLAWLMGVSTHRGQHSHGCGRPCPAALRRELTSSVQSAPSSVTTARSHCSDTKYERAGQGGWCGLEARTKFLGQMEPEPGQGAQPRSQVFSATPVSHLGLH